MFHTFAERNKVPSCLKIGYACVKATYNSQCLEEREDSYYADKKLFPASNKKI
jgi:hypothetical protein